MKIKNKVEHMSMLHKMGIRHDMGVSFAVSQVTKNTIGRIQFGFQDTAMYCRNESFFL